MAQINKPNTYFNTVLYTGNGSTQSITGVGFQPDLIWSKGRSLAGFDHSVTDSSRGNTKRIFPSRTDGDVTCTVAVTSFDSDGFSLGNDNCATLANLNNYNTQTYVNWLWKANGGTTSSNTSGSITSTVQANTTSGFSIVKYTGTGANATVGHGLGVAPKMIIGKGLGNAINWTVGGSNISSNWTSSLALNSTAAVNVANYWQDQAPNTSTFALSSDIGVNASGLDFIAYCFAEKKGFSKFGSYTGNGSSDGPFVYTGFKPAFVVLKRSDSSPFDWFMHDNKRNGFNPDNDYLQANTSSSETNFDGLIDFVSNGFKIRTTSTAYNASGGTYIYMCFAENPLVGTNNIPATAR